MALLSQPSDDALVSRMARRDQEALSALYDRYRRVVYGLALRILKDRAEAEEVLTDVFFQAWRSAEGFDRLRGSVAGWLLTLCRSRAIDRLRSLGRRATGMTLLARGTVDPPRSEADEAVDLQMKRKRIGAALMHLTPQQRDALELAYYGGLSHSEIAAKLGEPLGTVKTRIRQALMLLRDNLGEQFEP